MKAEYTILSVIIFIGASLSLLLFYPFPQNELDSKIESGEIENWATYKEIVDPAGFVNSEPFSIEQFVGNKVILVDFLTYSCINCQRTFPYINAWYEKYKDRGLEIIGIHTPEFAFEKDVANVREAMKKFGITHPVVLDNEYSTWRAWGNKYWPRKYLIDIKGNVVYDHIGEGAYEETEQKIIELLEERGEVLGEKEIQEKGALASSKISENYSLAKSPEVYFGSDRNEYLQNGKPGETGIQNLFIPDKIDLNRLYLEGKWDITSEYAKNINPESKIVFKFNARNVYFVAGANSLIKISLILDGKNIGTKTIQKNTLYDVVSDITPGEHTLEIIVHDSGLEVYTFTFG